MCRLHAYEPAKLLNATDMTTRLFDAQNVELILIDKTVFALESILLSLFWPSQAIIGNCKYKFPAFRDLIDSYRIQLRHFPPKGYLII